MRFKKLAVLGTAILILSACGGGGDAGSNLGVALNIACSSTANDSVQTVDGWTRIHSENFGRYESIGLSRDNLSGSPTNIDYMLHEPPGIPAALLVLIAGGQLDAGIEGTQGSTPSNANGNFLVRSAHLFAAQGYRVVTIDRPSDYQDFLNTDPTFDNYRTSVAHAVDLSNILQSEGVAEDLPVILVGTSRGSISVVAQHFLASAVVISGPLTSGGGTPTGTGNILPANVTEPVQVSWHVLDGCSVTTPANAESLVNDFPDATGVAISGGFASASAVSPCKANHYHGFPGIESCAVKQETDWVAGVLAALPTTRPTVSEVTSGTLLNTQKMLDIDGFATAAAGGALTYSLPHATSSLGGSVSITGTTVTYNPPVGVSGLIDSFVYVVNESGGGTGHALIEILITP